MVSYSPALYQFEIFGAAILMGVTLGILIDFYRMFRKYFSPGLKTTPYVDFIFWCIVSTGFIAFIIIKLWGEVYFFSYLGLVSGYLIYLYFFSRHVAMFWDRALKAVYKIVVKIWRTIKKTGVKINKILKICAGWQEFLIKVKKLFWYS